MSKTLTDKPDPPPQDLGVNIPWSVTLSHHSQLYLHPCNTEVTITHAS